MDLKLESREGYLLATASGRVSLKKALSCCKNVCDAAAERGFGKILFDYLAVDGDLSVMEWYEIGKTIAEYRLNRSLTPIVAVIRKLPTIMEFGADVARNRGLMVATFSDHQAAMDWLKGFGSKAAGS